MHWAGSVYFHFSFLGLCQFISEYMISKVGDGLKL